MALRSAPRVSPCTHSAPPHASRPVRRRLATLGALTFGLLAPFVVATAPASALTVPPRTAYEHYLAVTVQTVINAERAAHGLAPVSMDSHLMLSARRHNVTMARWNTMSHQLPSEPYFGTRMTAAGYTWTWAGENIGWNSLMTTRGMVTLERLMYNETAPNDGHRQNILSTHFRNVGVDVYLDGVHHKAWLTTDFGHH
jgi:uncharacterized protein YkwD